VLRSPRLTHLVLLAAVFTALHALCLLHFPAQSTILTYPFMLLAPSIALACACWRAVDGRGEPTSHWVLLSVGLLFWTCGMLLSAWEDILEHAPQSTAWFSDFTYFLYGVPVLLAISSGSAEQRDPIFLWVDAIQSLLAGFLVYVSIFSVVPFSDTPPAPAQVSVLVLTYNVENLMLAVAATLRLFAEPRGPGRRFYGILSSFLWIYALMAYVYNRLAAQTEGHTAIDVLVDLPFLILAIAIVKSRSRDDDAVEPLHDRKLTPLLFIESLSPVFYTVALLALSISLMGRHAHVGIAGIFIALVAYATRSTLLQVRYIRVQRELRDRQERLEQMAVTDALTNTANRRRFDEMLALESDRAIRNGHPLALLLVDVDRFKMLNDRYGHPAGDRCLVSIALALQSTLARSGDLLARYGGEEFAVILPATDAAGARRVAVAMQEAVRALQIPNETATGAFVTISVGIAVFDQPGGSAAMIVDAADKALYRAKRLGRDRIEVAAETD
jgi:diguanylate cyclase (GGDEF)-like protein